MRSCLHACLEREKPYAPQDPSLGGNTRYSGDRRLRTYLCPYLYAKVYFNIIIYYTLQREAQNKETGVRTTEDRMEKVRRELHLPVR